MRDQEDHKLGKWSRRRGRLHARCSCGETFKGTDELEVNRKFEAHVIDDYHLSQYGQ
jgi:hypothetical protein